MKKIFGVLLIGLVSIIYISIQSPFVRGESNNEFYNNISTGSDTVVAVTKEGELYTWGRNLYYQLGDGTTDNSNIPINITSRLNLNVDEIVTLVDAGSHHSAALTNEGRLFTWGANEDGGQLGDGTLTNSDTPIDITPQFLLETEEKIIEVDLGQYFSLALTSDGRVFTWGNNERGQLGNNSNTNSATPIDITSQFSFGVDEVITEVDLGSEHALVITSLGRVFAWGRNYNGELGDNTNDDKLVPTEITINFSLGTDETVILIEGGERYSIATTSIGRVFTWGKNNFYQLGDSTDVDKNTPQDITSSFSLDTSELVISVNAGIAHTGIVTSYGRVFTWGQDAYNKLGHEENGHNETPYEITDNFTLEEGENVVSLDLGYTFSSAVTSLGHLYLWGSNDRGQIGDGSSEIIIELPKMISLLLVQPDTTPPTFDTIVDQTIEIAITDVDWSSFIVNEADNRAGELTKVEYEDNVMYHVLGTYTVTVKLIDVSMNETSQTFNVTVVDTAPLVEERDITKLFEDDNIYFDKSIVFMQVELGVSISGGLTTDNRVFMWGLNEYGQIGDETFIAKYHPEDITNKFSLLEDEVVTKIALGDNHTLAITDLGNIFTWGLNDEGQLGDSTIENRNLPTNITDNFNLNEGEKIIDITAGGGFSVALTSDSRVLSFGDNSYLQLGEEIITGSNTPIDITDNLSLEVGEEVVQVTSGQYHSMVITSEDRILSWGLNQHGQLGNNSTDNSAIAVDITSGFNLDSNESILNIDLGANHSIALSSLGRVFTWGYGSSGQLGKGSFTDSLVPGDINWYLPLDSAEIVTSVSAHLNTSSVVTSIGNVLTWGENDFGQLGDDTKISKPLAVNITNNFDLGDDEIIVSTSLGFHHSSAISSLGRVYMWGQNSYGCLGKEEISESLHPIEVLSAYLDIEEIADKKVKDISMGQNHTLLLTEDNQVYTFGYNGHGQLGDDTTLDKLEPTNITNYFNLNEGELIIDVEAGAHHSMALSSTGRVFTWGWNEYGQLGTNNFSESTVPIEIFHPFTLAEGEQVTNISAGSFHSAALTNIGTLFTWGLNDKGQIGDGTYTTMPHPLYINDRFGLDSEEIVVSISLGYKSSSFLTSLGRVYTWGHNENGELGDTTLANKNTPRDVTDFFLLQTDEVIENVYMGLMNSVTITSNSRVFIWGAALFSDHTGSSPPMQIYPFPLAEGAEIIDVGVGGTHLMYLTSNSILYTWGENDYGQLGDGTTVADNVAKNIVPNFGLHPDEEIISIEAGLYNSSALTSEGRVFTWGYNENGELGDSTRVDKPYPTEIFIDPFDSIEIKFLEFESGNSSPISLDYLTLVLYPTYDLSGYVKSVVIDGVEYNNPVFDGGLIKIEIENTYNLYEIVEVNIDSIKLIDDTVIIPDGDTYVATRIMPDTALSFDLIEDQIIEAGQYNYIDWTVIMTNLTGRDGAIFTTSIEFNDVILDSVGDYTVTVKLMDDLGDFITQTFSVTVVDTTPPTFDLIEDQTIEAGEFTDIDWTTLIVNENDNSDTVLVKSEFLDTVDYDTPGIYYIILLLEDFSTDGWSQLVNVTVVDTTPPTFDVDDHSFPIDNEGFAYVDATNLVVHYYRPDGLYDGWNVWIWDDETGTGGVGLDFDSTDDFGVVLNLDLSTTDHPYDETDSIGIIIRLSDEHNEWLEKDVDNDRFINMELTNIDGEVHVYITSGVEQIIQGEPQTNIDLLDYIYNISDNSDGDLSVFIDYTVVDYQQAGVYSVLIRVEDESGNYLEKTIDITIYDDNPILALEEVYVEKGVGGYWLIDYIVATNIGESVTYTTDGEIDWNTAGIHSLTIETNLGDYDYSVIIFDRIDGNDEYIDGIYFNNFRPHLFNDDFSLNEAYLMYNNQPYFSFDESVGLGHHEYAREAVTYLFNIENKLIVVEKEFIFADFDVYTEIVVGSDPVEWCGYQWAIIAHPEYDGVEHHLDYYLDVDVITNNVNYDVPGTYTVTLETLDRYGTVITNTLYVTVTPEYSKPTLLPGIDTIYRGDDWVDSGVYYSDFYNTLVTEGSVDTDTLGVYIITYELSDGGLNIEYLQRYVTVLEKEEEVEFVLNNSKTTYILDETFTEPTCRVLVGGEYLECNLLSSNVNTSVPGIYEVVHYVDINDERYTYITYVFVMIPGNDLVLYYRKEEEVLI